MRPLLKFAWINLVIVAVILVWLLFSYLSKGVLNLNSGVIALFAAGIFVFKFSKAKVIKDERDEEIERQATMAGLWAVFIYFVSAGVYVVLDFENNFIPRHVFINFFVAGYIIFFFVMSSVIVLLFGWEKEKSGGFLESLREMSGIQKESLVTLPMIAALLIFALMRFPVNGSSPYNISLGTALLLIPSAAFFLFPYFIHTGRDYESFRPVINRARRVMLLSALIAIIIELLSLGALFVIKGSEAIYTNLFLVSGYCALSLGTLVFLACLLVRPANLEVTRQ